MRHVHAASRSRWVLALGLALLSACGGGGGGGGDDSPGFDPVTAQAFVATYANLLHRNYSDAHDLAVGLQADIEAFVASPTAPGLEAARATWVQIRPYYLQTEIARFYDGPIDRAPDGPEAFVNAWPLDEAHLDYVEGLPLAGLVNDVVGFPTIDETSVRAANEAGGEANIACGWHAIEFLLWGQDGTLGAPAGQRSFVDYVTDGSSPAPNPARRGEYLRVLAQMLVDDLASVRDEWAPATGPYRASFLALPLAEALGRAMTGMGTLAFGELRGERLLVPMTSKLAEDEHSCFSDTTHQDHLNDARGLQNAWLGHYLSSDGGLDVTGTGLRDVAALRDPARAAQLTAILEDLLEALGAPEVIPFEVAVQGLDTDPGRARLLEAMSLLSQFNVVFSAIAAELGVDITTSL